MSDDLQELHDELRAVARELLGKAGPDGPALSLLADTGWLGLEAPEPLGGAGAGFAEMAVVLEEMGRGASAGPFLGAVVLGVGALDLLAPAPARDALLARVATGEATVAVALVDGDRADDLDVAAAPPFRIERGDVTRVRGRAAFVPDATRADHLLLLASDAAHGLVIVAVDPRADGIDVVDQPLLDGTRPFASATVDGLEVDDASVLSFAADPGACVTALLDRAALAVTVDALGVCEAMLEATVEYAKVREQFGRPIGSFQAVKHACADMAVHTAVARELVDAALEQVTADPLDASVAVSMAKAYVGPAAVDLAGAAMQLHGGIGYTWESGIHAYLKRAALDQALFGSARAHRRRLARRYPPR
jgi:alkylation response protein AidB-like acyl-CoA dehydrogenase